MDSSLRLISLARFGMKYYIFPSMLVDWISLLVPAYLVMLNASFICVTCVIWIPAMILA